MPDDQIWDDLHFGVSDPETKTNTEDDDDALIESKTFDTEDGLESSTDKTVELDPIVPVVKTGDDKGTDDKDKTPISENVTGVELYLAQFDIEGGMIKFDDGTSKHFNDLSAEEQAEVLQTLHGNQASSVEEKYGLDENEIGLINYLRSNNVSVEEFIDSEVQSRVTKMMTLQELSSEDYATMDADVIYTKFLKTSNPEATPEQIAADLLKAKELSNFTKLTDNLKAQYVAEQKANVDKKLADDAKAHTDMIESQRKEIIQAVLPLEEVAGVKLDQNIKNTVLDQILETNTDGDSAFMDKIFSDPQSLFKAAFWYVYGDALIAQRDEYWKKEKSAAYKRGKEEAMGITSTGGSKSFTAKKADPHTSSGKSSRNDETDWSDLYQ